MNLKGPAKRKIIRIPKTVDQKYLGPEPSDASTKIKFIQACSWYNYFYDAKERAGFLYEYLKNRKHDLAAIKKVPEGDLLASLCYWARMINKGYPVDDAISLNCQKKLEDLLEYARSLEDKTVQKVEERKSPYQAMVDKANDYIADIECEVDKVILGHKNDFSLYNWLTANQIPAPIAKIIHDYYKPQANDEDAKGHYRSFIESLVSDALAFSQNKLKQRKPRATKPKKVENQVSKMKYLKEYPQLKLVSESPTKIINAQEVWVYDIEKRTLGVFYAKDESGLHVSGTTITGFNESKSIKKTIRKPETFLSMFKGLGKVKIRTVMDNIAAKPQTLLGRTNDNLIILKVY